MRASGPAGWLALALAAACTTSGTSPRVENTTAGGSGAPASASAPSVRFEGFWQEGSLALAAPGELPAWTIQPSASIALIIYRSEGSSHGNADNEELVVQLSSAELAAGSPISLDSPGRVVRYQRGARKLTYASTTLKGTLTAKRDADRIRGEASLTASSPSVNATGGPADLSRQLSFDLDRK